MPTKRAHQLYGMFLFMQNQLITQWGTRALLASLLLFGLSACGHTGPLYFPEDAAAHEHHPAKSKPPKSAATATQTEDYPDLDTLTISQTIEEEEESDAPPP